jgi:hypothetical protein
MREFLNFLLMSPFSGVTRFGENKNGINIINMGSDLIIEI